MARKPEALKISRKLANGLPPVKPHRVELVGQVMVDGEIDWGLPKN